MIVEGTDEELKYLEHFGLRFNPFPVAPDLENFFLSHNIDLLINEIVHGILTRKGFMVLTGEIGLGKTTISRKILSILDEKRVETSLVFHTTYQDVELLKEINRDFGLQAESEKFGEQMRLLNKFLLDQNSQGKNCAIIIDDAQNLNKKSLELVRMISNLETDQQKLVQILLIGQPELMDKLNSSELRQLKSRIVIRREARPLNLEEVNSYLLFKLNAAGNNGRTRVRKSAVRKIHRLTRGNFRQINTLMDRCLYAAYLHDTTEITSGIVKEAYGDLFPRKTPSVRKSVAWGLSFLVIFSIAGILVYSGFLFQTPFMGSVSRSPVPTVAPRHKIEPQASRDTPYVGHPVRAQAGVEISVPAPIKDFLRIYHLSEYERPLFDALKTRRFREVSDRIYEHTGYRLILLHSVPDSVREKYGILAYPSEAGGGETYFLFWRPRIQLKKFYYGYRGEDIRELQEMLATEHFYEDHIDGIVGKNLMKAVIHFQEKAGLPITGVPDDTTLFLLCHSAEAGNKADS